MEFKFNVQMKHFLIVAVIIEHKTPTIMQHIYKHQKFQQPNVQIIEIKPI